MKLKVDENDQAVFVDGKPVYIGEDEKEVPVDVPGLFQKVAELNAEAKAHRTKAPEPLSNGGLAETRKSHAPTFANRDLQPEKRPCHPFFYLLQTPTMPSLSLVQLWTA
jgi:hypothetical protein